ncbi:MAG TPA: hypothetical protein DCY79_12490 [Planctomycetaceae bacterium]|nr:hypothetical protein [Planctomycetaceae bacterium]
MEFLLASAGPEIATWKTILFGLLLVGLVLCLAFEEKLHAKKSVISGSFAIVCLFLGAVLNILPFEDVVVGSHEAIDIVASEHYDGAEPSHASHSEQKLEGEVLHQVDGHRQSVTLQVHDEHADEDVQHGAEDEHVNVGGHRLSMPVFIPGIDWSVIAIILGSSLFVDVTSKSGLFTWIAIRVTKVSGGDPLKLLFYYGVMTVVFSAVLNNVTAMIIVGSLTVVSLEKLNRREKLLGFLLIEGLLTNIGGLLTLISSVPNIIVGTAAQISFVMFFLKAGPYVLVATVVTIFMGARLFGIHSLKTAEEREEARKQVSGFDENDGIASWGFFWFATGMLILFILVIATTSILPARLDLLGMGFVALTFAGIMLIRYKSQADEFYRSIDWDLLGFFMALFVVIYVMEHAQVLHAIGSGLQLVVFHIDDSFGTLSDASVLLAGSAVFSSVTDNIPLAAMLANILTTLGAPTAAAGTESGLWWAVVFGANLGGNLTPIGSASTLVAVTIMHKHKLPMSFANFVKAAAPFAIAHILMAVVYVILLIQVTRALS